MNELINTQSNQLGINDFLNASQKYTENVFSNLNMQNLFSSSISGNLGNVFDLKNILKIFLSEMSTSINLIVSIFIVIIIHSIFKAIVQGLGNSTSSKVVYFVQYLIIVTIIINSFISILEMTQNSISDIINFMNLLIPLLMTLMLTTGTLVTTSVTQPILIFMINFIGNFINLFIIPLVLVAMTISIISNISDKIQINKLSKFLKSSVIWMLGIILTVFSCVLSIEGTLSSSVDGLTGKTAKAAVSSFIPIVGKILGDTVDSVIGCGNILKNSVGIIGVIIISCIVLVPMVKILILWFSFKMTAAVCEVVADDRIIKLLDQIADGYKIMLAILVSISVMFIIGITIVLKITNSALMYR